MPVVPDDLERVRAYLDLFHPVGPEAFSALAAALRERHWPKGAVITGVGDVQREALFILEGVQYSYFLKDDQPYVMAFTYPVGLSGIPESFLSQQPSAYALEAISATLALALPHADLMRLFDAHPALERLFRKIAEAMLIAAAHGRYRQMSTTAEERFQQFMQQSAPLLQMVPHRLIASYLGMHPTNLSKLFNHGRLKDQPR